MHGAVPVPVGQHPWALFTLFVAHVCDPAPDLTLHVNDLTIFVLLV